jgi:hypothetical protein
VGFSTVSPWKKAGRGHSGASAEWNPGISKKITRTLHVSIATVVIMSLQDAILFDVIRARKWDI